MIAAGFHFVIVFFTFYVHEVEFIDQGKSLEQRDGPIDSCAVNLRILLFRERQQCRRIQVARRILDDSDEQPTLFGHAHTTSSQFFHEGTASDGGLVPRSSDLRLRRKNGAVRHG